MPRRRPDRGCERSTREPGRGAYVRTRSKLFQDAAEPGSQLDLGHPPELPPGPLYVETAAHHLAGARWSKRGIGEPVARLVTHLVQGGQQVENRRLAAMADVD